MRVLHVIPSYLPATRYGGPVFATHALCRALVAEGCDVTVFTTNVDGAANLDVRPGEEIGMDGVRVRYFECSALRRLYHSPAMGRALRDIPAYDLVHTHSVFLWPTWAAARAARRRSIPYIVAPRGMLVRDLIERKSRALKSAWIHLIEKSNIEGASGIHVTSGVEAEELRRFGFRLPPIFSIPNGVDVEPERGQSMTDAAIESAFDRKLPVVLALGRIHWKKGLDRLIEAMAHVDNAHALIVGNDEDGYAHQLRALAARLGVSDRITIAGPAYGAYKAGIYARASMLVLPSHSENFGNVVLEALAHGCPAVVTREVGAAQIVAELGAGCVVGGSPAELAGAISGLLAQPRMLEDWKATLPHKVRERYSWRSVARSTMRAYESLVAG